MKYLLDLMEREHVITTEEDRQVSAYGLALLLNAAANMIVLFLIGALMGCLRGTVIFYLTYLVMKKDTGGYHAASHVGCVVQFNLVCAGLLWSLRAFGLWMPRWALLAIFLILVMALAPVASASKPISVLRYAQHRRKSRFKAVCICLLLPCLSVWTAVEEAWLDYAYLGLLMLCITLSLGALQNRRRREDYERVKNRNL